MKSGGNTADRPYIDKTQPEVYKAVVKAAAASRAASEDAGLDVALLELVNVRVSQINGCVTCLSIHTPAARDAGVEQVKIDVLPAWREAQCFTGVERAALGLAEALTLITEHDLAEAQRQVSAVLTTQALAALEWNITMMNAFNRISIASAHPPRLPQ